MTNSFNVTVSACALQYYPRVAPGVCGCAWPDADTDGDGVLDCLEECPADRFKTAAGVCGCSVPDVDRDGDGVVDCPESCKDHTALCWQPLCARYVISLP